MTAHRRIGTKDLDGLIKEVQNHPDWPIILDDSLYTRGTVLIQVDGVTVSLQRYLYRMCIGPIPDRVKMFQASVKGNVNPHLFDIPSKRPRKFKTEKPFRSGESWLGDVNRAKTHCPRGHEYSEENTLYWPSEGGRRRCKTCERDKAKNRWKKESA